MTNKENDDEIINLVKTVLDNGSGTAESLSEHVLIKLMQIRKTPIENFTFDQDRVDRLYTNWLKTRSENTETFKSILWEEIEGSKIVGMIVDSFQPTPRHKKHSILSLKKASQFEYFAKEDKGVSVGDVYYGTAGEYTGWMEVVEVKLC